MVVDQERAVPEARRRPRARLITASAVAVLLVVGVVTAVKIAFRYAHAPALTCVCGLVWSNQDNRRMHYSKAGFYEAHGTKASARAGC